VIVIEIAAAVVGLIVAYFIGKRIVHNSRRKKLLNAALPEEYARIIERNVPLYRRLPDSLKQQLGGLISVFLAEKHFEGCGGLEITDEIKVTIAAQACVLLLNRKTGYFPKLGTILVYPHTYVAKSVSSEGGVVAEERSVRLGESWQRGPVVLAWDSARGGTSNAVDAQNVVIHEFAHQLDQENGDVDGAPELGNRSRYRAWAQVLSAEYEALQKKKETRSRSVMDKYGATDPAEFFAVATETFFEKSAQMRKNHPELYEELKDYYKLDPAEWV